MHFRNLLDCLYPAVLSLQQVSRPGGQDSHEDQSLRMSGFLQLSEEDLIICFLIMWSAADTNHNVAHVVLPANPVSQALS